MLNWINKLPRAAKVLDLGCGKLRYTVPLAKRVSSVIAVDSAIQLDRKQLLFGKKRSVREYVSKALPNVHLNSFDNENWRLRRYDIILCSNVLSAIPCRKTRKALMKAARCCLAAHGELLVTTQYKNSHFENWRTTKKATKYLDGFLVRGKRGTSFYALLDCTALARLCRHCGLRILKAAHVKELAYVLANRATK